MVQSAPIPPAEHLPVLPWGSPNLCAGKQREEQLGFGQERLNVCAVRAAPSQGCSRKGWDEEGGQGRVEGIGMSLQQHTRDC